MPFIPFVKEDGSPISVTLVKDVAELTIDHAHLRVHPDNLATAKMVMQNQLLEILLNYLLGKPNNEQTAYEAEEITLQYWRDLLVRGGIEW